MKNIFVENEIFEDINSHEIERILYIDAVDKFCTSIVIQTKKLIIRKRELKSFESDFRNGTIRILETDSTHRFVEQKNLTESEKIALDKSWDVIRYINTISSEPDIYFTKYRSKILEKVAIEFNLSNPTLYKLLRKYWQGGKQKMALVTDRYMCGGIGKDKILTTIKTGAPNTNVKLANGLDYDIKGLKEKEGRNITKEDKDIIETTIVKYFKNHNLSLPQIYERMKIDFYCEDITINGEKSRQIISSNNIPTFRQFEYWANKINVANNNKINIKRARMGEKKFDANCRGLNSTTSDQSFLPGFTFQIDATKSPFHLLNKFKTKSVGTPTVYMMVDSFSKYIVALYISLDAASWNCVMSTFLNLTEDKVEFCKRFDIDITSIQWLNSGMPRTILADRGEFAGTLPEHIIQYFNVVLENTPSYRGDYKPDIEQLFRLIEKELMPETPGFIESDFNERGTPDYRKTARLNLYEFTQLVINMIIKKNKRRMRRFVLTEEMIKDGVKKTPFEIFKWGIENHPGVMRTMSEEYIKQNLMRQDHATVTKHGISYKGRLYNCNTAKKQNWATEARINGVWQIDICFDDRNMDTIYFIDRKKNTTEACELQEHLNIYKSMSLKEVELQLMEDKKEEIEYQDEKNKISLDTHNNVMKIIKKAKADFKHLNPSGKVDVKNIRENRRIENVEIRRAQAISIKKDKPLKIKNKQFEKSPDIDALLETIKNAYKEI